MSIKRQAIRFNLNKEVDKKAWEYLQSLDKSQHKSVNRFVIDIISDYANKQHTEQTEKEFIDKVISAIRDELRANPAFNLFQMFGQLQQPQAPIEQNSAENEASALGFLGGFGSDN